MARHGLDKPWIWSCDLPDSVLRLAGSSTGSAGFDWPNSCENCCAEANTCEQANAESRLKSPGREVSRGSRRLVSEQFCPAVGSVVLRISCSVTVMHPQYTAWTELVPVITTVRIVLAWILGQSESKRHLRSVSRNPCSVAGFQVLRDKSQHHVSAVSRAS